MINPIVFCRGAQKLSRFGFPKLALLLDYFVRWFFGCWFPHTVDFGNDLVLGYGGLGIVVHHDCIIGNRVHIDQNVTLGGNGRQMGAPIISDDVYVGVGAVVLGPITIGAGSIIGANCVVLHSVPEFCLVVGVPGKIVKRNVSRRDYFQH